MHAALNEVGILYVSAGCHTGWDDGTKLKPLKRRPGLVRRDLGDSGQERTCATPWTMRLRSSDTTRRVSGPELLGHRLGLVRLRDPHLRRLVANAMDCWVAQLGVVTHEHEAIARSTTLRTDSAGKVLLAASKVLRNREISPFILNMGNNGALSNSGTFRTTPDDVRALVDVQLAKAREAWGMRDQTQSTCASTRTVDWSARTVRQRPPLPGFRCCTRTRSSRSSSCGRRISSRR